MFASPDECKSTKHFLFAPFLVSTISKFPLLVTTKSNQKKFVKFDCKKVSVLLDRKLFHAPLELMTWCLFVGAKKLKNVDQNNDAAAGQLNCEFKVTKAADSGDNSL